MGDLYDFSIVSETVDFSRGRLLVDEAVVGLSDCLVGDR